MLIIGSLTDEWSFRRLLKWGSTVKLRRKHGKRLSKEKTLMGDKPPSTLGAKFLVLVFAGLALCFAFAPFEQHYGGVLDYLQSKSTAYAGKLSKVSGTPTKNTEQGKSSEPLQAPRAVSSKKLVIHERKAVVDEITQNDTRELENLLTRIN